MIFCALEGIVITSLISAWTCIPYAFGYLKNWLIRMASK